MQTVFGNSLLNIPTVKTDMYDLRGYLEEILHHA